MGASADYPGLFGMDLQTELFQFSSGIGQGFLRSGAAVCKEQKIVSITNKGDIGPTEAVVKPRKIQIAKQGRKNCPLGDPPPAAKEACVVRSLGEPLLDQPHGIPLADESLQHPEQDLVGYGIEKTPDIRIHQPILADAYPLPHPGKGLGDRSARTVGKGIRMKDLFRARLQDNEKRPLHKLVPQVLSRKNSYAARGFLHGELAHGLRTIPSGQDIFPAGKYMGQQVVFQGVPRYRDRPRRMFPTQTPVQAGCS